MRCPDGLPRRARRRRVRRRLRRLVQREHHWNGVLWAENTEQRDTLLREAAAISIGVAEITLGIANNLPHASKASLRRNVTRSQEAVESRPVSPEQLLTRLAIAESVQATTYITQQEIQ